MPSALLLGIGRADAVAICRYVEEEMSWKTTCTTGALLRRTCYIYISCQYP